MEALWWTVRTIISRLLRLLKTTLTLEMVVTKGDYPQTVSLGAWKIGGTIAGR